MQGDFDGICPQIERLGDLPRGEIGAVAERDQLAVAVVEARDSTRQGQTADRCFFEVARIGAFGELGCELEAWRSTFDQAPRDSDQPGERLAFARVVALAIAQSTLKSLAREVLRVRPGADAIGDICIDPPNQRLRVPQRVNAKQRAPPLRCRCGKSGSGSPPRPAHAAIPLLR